jgi:hypothetical protein
MIKILHNLALFWVKNSNFFADHNIGPWTPILNKKAVKTIPAKSEDAKMAADLLL